MSTLELRVEAALEKPVSLAEDYVKFDRGNIVEVLCKVCGKTIRKMIPMDDAPEVVRRGSQTIIREKMVLACLPNYREVKVLFADGSSHVTPVCVDDAGKLSDAGIREEVYAIDLKQWAREGEVSDAMATRNPVSITSIGEMIQ